MDKIYYSQHSSDRNLICIYDESLSRIVYCSKEGDVFQFPDSVHIEDIVKETEKEADSFLSELWNMMAQ